MAAITIYRDAQGEWQLTKSEMALEVVADLRTPYRVALGKRGELCITSNQSSVEMTAEQAVHAGILEIPAILSR